ncbi:hypothetical protein TIFTF001_028377 [Ficus carica]|uniref:Uncharacterized protein n=1 Tax=Ficus carica TaxID=3494 RepID=A0AA88IWG5_FICCA|nr:hypothetical protein TIFTF001_028377 [Ficus carica]
MKQNQIITTQTVYYALLWKTPLIPTKLNGFTGPIWGVFLFSKQIDAAVKKGYGFVGVGLGSSYRRLEWGSGGVLGQIGGGPFQSHIAEIIALRAGLDMAKACGLAKV